LHILNQIAIGSYPTAWLERVTTNVQSFHDEGEGEGENEDEDEEDPLPPVAIEQTFRFGNLDPAGSVVTMDLATTIMKKHIAVLSSFGPLVLVLALALAGSQPVAAQPVTAPKDSAPSFSYAPTDDTNNPALVAWQQAFGASHNERMQWWREARFGMFIHWGVYSVPAGVWNGTNVGRSGAEWIMNRGRISMADYEKLPAQFDPEKFNADEWVSIAKNAGMKYIVITAKHHDGFAMFHSQASAFNIYDATPFKRDPLKELADACAKAGIKLGFYYSQAQDWNHPGGAAAGGHWDPAQDGDMDKFIDTVDIPQVKELLTNYGKVAVIWWDTPVNMTPERAEKLLPLLKLQPDIISNNRLDSKKLTGDYGTPENKIPTNALASDWETCMTMNGTWGYRAADSKWKSTETLLHNLIDIASKGGNFLLNVGPTSEGLIPGPSVERLHQMGDWMKVNGVAIYGTSKSPLKAQPSWGRVTQKDNTLYLHVFDWPKDGKIMVPGLKNKAVTATLLADGSKLKTSTGDGGVTVSVPVIAPDAISSTIVLKLKGAVEVE
jgi:alpha-L-fucosidase